VEGCGNVPNGRHLMQAMVNGGHAQLWEEFGRNAVQEGTSVCPTHLDFSPEKQN
jgi:hypothetical protein